MSQAATLDRVLRHPGENRESSDNLICPTLKPVQREIRNPGIELLFVTVACKQFYSMQPQSFTRKLAFQVDKCERTFGSETGYEISLCLLDGTGRIRARYGFGPCQWHFPADKVPDGSVAAQAKESV